MFGFFSEFSDDLKLIEDVFPLSDFNKALDRARTSSRKVILVK